MGQSANDRAFYDNLSRLTEGSVRSVLSSVKEAPDDSTVRAGRMSGHYSVLGAASPSSSSESENGAPARTVTSARATAQGWVLPVARATLLITVGFPWIVGLIALGWFL